MDWYLKVMRQYADFSGRARRMEYWMFAVINLVITFVLAGVGIGIMAAMGSTDHAGFGVLFLAPVFLYALVIIIPSLAVTVRRLHDTGRSGWWYFIGLVPVVGPIILLVFYFSASQPGPNAWGPNPKEPFPVPGYPMPPYQPPTA